MNNNQGKTYQEILPEVLEGKWVKSQTTRTHWVRLLESGKWECETDSDLPEFTMERFEFLKNTWQVKPEEIYVWAVSHNSGEGFNNYVGSLPGVDHLKVSYEKLSGSPSPKFPIDKPVRYRLELDPVDPDE